MNVGIIIYSKTGNTLSVAQKLKSALEKKGHTAKIEQIKADVDDKTGKFTLLYLPDAAPYDRLVFASPVWAFTLCPVMREYLSAIGQSNGRSACCFVTQQLKYAWAGGNRAIRKMSRLCTQKGLDVIGDGVVMWSRGELDKQISELTDRLASL